jgi:NADPH-dependent curcumin reductase CurA
MSTVNRRIVLKLRPTGIPLPEHFKRDDEPPATPGAGQFLVEAHGARHVPFGQQVGVAQERWRSRP